MILGLMTCTSVTCASVSLASATVRSGWEGLERTTAG